MTTTVGTFDQPKRKSSPDTTNPARKISPENATTPFCVDSFSLLSSRFSSSFGAFKSNTMPSKSIGINKSAIKSHAPEKPTVPVGRKSSNPTRIKPDMNFISALNISFISFSSKYLYIEYSTKTTFYQPCHHKKALCIRQKSAVCKGLFLINLKNVRDIPRHNERLPLHRLRQ